MSTFESLSYLTMGCILHELNLATGSEGIVHNADLLVMLRSVRNLAMTSKAIAEKVNSAEAVLAILESLSNKYNLPLEELADKLNTAGARKWIWQNIPRWKADKIFQAQRDIIELIEAAFGEVNATGLQSEYSGLSIRREYFTFIIRGQLVEIDGPLGKTTLRPNKILRINDLYSVVEVLIKRLNATFMEFGSKHLGTQDLIIDQFTSVGSSMGPYRIGIVDEEILLEANLTKKMRTGKLVDTIWHMLEANRTGGDPLARTIKTETATALRKEPTFKNISEISKWAVSVIAQVQRQPGSSWTAGSKESRFLEMKNHDVVSMISSINLVAGFNDKLHLRIYCSNELELKTDTAEISHDLAQLECAYDAVIQGISQNWRREYLKNSPWISATFSEEEFMLFYNPEALVCTSSVIEFFAQEACFPVFPVGNYYMWIKKDRLEETLNALNIHPVI